MFDKSWRVADILTKHPECVCVLVEHRIDFWFRGDRTLETACLESGADVDAVAAAMRASVAAGKTPAQVDPRALSTPELISYIVSRHHAYVFSSLPFVDALADRVVAECGLDDTDVFALRDEIRVLSGRLRTHLHEEEAVLFPALRAEPMDRDAIARELARMDEEHALVRAQIAKVRALAERCGVAAESGTARGLLLREIGALEYDTLRHIDVETNVLLRRVA